LQGGEVSFAEQGIGLVSFSHSFDGAGAYDSRAPRSLAPEVSPFGAACWSLK